MDVESEVSADAAAAATNGLGGAGEAAAEDAEAVVVTNGLAGGGEASAEQRSLEAYAALYSGRTRLARLVFIAQRCGVEAIELAALRMAHDEAKAREDTAFYREAALRINGRLGPTHLLDQDWVDSVNHRAEQRKENLETELEVYKTSLHGESIRICYNDLGDFYYSHGRLTEAFKSYIKTEEYFSASEHVVQMYMKAILISVELGHNVRVLNFVSKAQGCQDPLSPIAIAKLQAVAGLARLGRKEYKLAAQEFLETGPELGSNYSEVIAAQDVATYGSLCALAFFNYSDIKMKVIENAKFGSFLSLFPEIRGLVNDFYYSQDKSCMKHLESLKPSLLVDIHLADHVEILYLLILQKLDYMASSYTATISELQWVTPTSSPAQNEAEGDPHVNGNEAQLNAMCNLILHPNFNDDAALVQSTQYNFVKSKELLQSLGEKSPKWVSRSQACALLLNAEMFVADSFETEARAIRWVDGQIIVISNTKFSMLEVEFGNYTTTCKPLKEKKLKCKEDSTIDRFEMRGNIWVRRRTCLRDNSAFHLIQWRRTSGLRRVQVQQPREASSQNDSNTLLKELHVTMKSLLEELKVNTKTATESSQLIAKSCQEVIEACKISASSTGTGIVN